MALDLKMLDSLPDNLIELYAEVEQSILSDMARRINSYDYFIPAAQHQKQKLQELGMVREDIISALSSLTGKSQQEIIDMLTEAEAQTIEDDVEYYTAAEVYAPDKVDTEALYKNLNAGIVKTQRAFFNITGTTANTSSKQFERALDKVWAQVNTGTLDYNTAITNAIRELSEKGLGSIEYKNGRIDNIEVAVRRAAMTGINQTAMITQETLADQLGVDLVEVTAHGGARPEHAKWQGKIYSRNGKKTINGETFEDLRAATGYGKVTGLGGVNCRHSFHPYVYGTSKTYTQKQLEEYNAKKIEYNGEKYTEYEASQIQRGIEREIRKAKRTIAAVEAAGGDASSEKTKLRALQKQYTEFSNQTGIKKQQARTKIG